MKKIVLIIPVIIITIVISFFVTMRLNSYNLFRVNTPKKVPAGFRRVNIEKKIPPEKDWYFIVTYENPKKQQVVFHYEPHRNIRCGQDPWKKDLAVFKPAGSGEGCSFYIENFVNNKQANLHWFLWNKGDNTYHIYDQESVLTNQEIMSMAESVGAEIVIAKDLTNKK